MQNFNYHNPAKIIFGKDSEKEVQALLHDLNVHSLLLVYSGDFIKTLGIFDTVKDACEKENIVFDLASAELPLSVTFSPIVGEQNENIYRGVLTWGEEILDLTDVYVEEEKELEGFFIDLNGDGQVEFVLHSQNIGGFISAFELNLNRENPSAAEVLSLDLGD